MDTTVLEQLIENKNYCVRVFPYMDSSYFDNIVDKIIFKTISFYVAKYSKAPSYNSIRIMLSNSSSMDEEKYRLANERLDEIQQREKDEYDCDWLFDETERWAKEKSLENAILKSVEIYKDSSQDNGVIQSIIEGALMISFNDDIGIDFFDEDCIASRWLRYHATNERYATNLTEFNEVTGGGYETKTLSVILGGTHSGKSAGMCSHCADVVTNGTDSLYITLEMSEDKISQRIEANMLDVEINEIPNVPTESFKGKMLALKGKTSGRLFIKEFPTGIATINHIKKLLNDLKLKKQFVPKVIFVDYINLMSSIRVQGKSYEVVKAIAEELRGIAVMYDCAVVTATQTNREGSKSSDVDMTDTAESFGLPATADLMIAIISPEDLKEQGIQIWKVIKNRLTGIVGYKFPVRTQFSYGRISDMDRSHHAIDEVEIRNSEETKLKMQKLQEKSKLKEIKVDFGDVINDIDDLLVE